MKAYGVRWRWPLVKQQHLSDNDAAPFIRQLKCAASTGRTPFNLLPVHPQVARRKTTNLLESPYICIATPRAEKLPLMKSIELYIRTGHFRNCFAREKTPGSSDDGEIRDDRGDRAGRTAAGTAAGRG